MQVGQTASRTLKVTSEHVRLHTEITGERWFAGFVEIAPSC